MRIFHYINVLINKKYNFKIDAMEKIIEFISPFSSMIFSIATKKISIADWVFERKQNVNAVQSIDNIL